jgi:hypothetical protein
VQRAFDAESKLAPVVDAPPEVLRLLLKDADVRDTLASEVDGRLPRPWYDATTVELAAGGPGALLVRGNCPLCGAHAAWFWIFAQRSGRWRLLLHAVGDELEVMEHRTLGFRDIRSMYVTAVASSSVLYRYNGRAYVAERRTAQQQR